MNAQLSIFLQKADIVLLPSRWNTTPPDIVSHQTGDHYVRKHDSAILHVPGVMVPQVFNFLNHPLHQDIASIQITIVQPLILDHRLSGKLTSSELNAMILSRGEFIMLKSCNLPQLSSYGYPVNNTWHHHPDNRLCELCITSFARSACSFH